MGKQVSIAHNGAQFNRVESKYRSDFENASVRRDNNQKQRAAGENANEVTAAPTNLDTSAAKNQNDGSTKSDPITFYDNNWGCGMEVDDFVSSGELEMENNVWDFAAPSIIMDSLLFNDDLDD